MTRTLFSIVAAFAAVALLCGGCASTGINKKQTEQVLKDAGFTPVKAVTDSQKQQLMSLRPKLVSSVQRNGKTYYVYPDRANQVLYIGGETELKSYQTLAPIYAESLALSPDFKAVAHDGPFPGWEQLWGND